MMFKVTLKSDLMYKISAWHVYKARFHRSQRMHNGKKGSYSEDISTA